MHVTGWVRVDFTLTPPPAHSVAPRILFRQVLDVFAFRQPGTLRFSVYFDLDKTGRDLAIDLGSPANAVKPERVSFCAAEQWTIALSTIRRHPYLLPEMGEAALRCVAALARGRIGQMSTIARTIALRIGLLKNVGALRGADAYAAWIATESGTEVISPAPNEQAAGAPLVSFILEPGAHTSEAFHATLASLVRQSLGSWELLVPGSVSNGPLPSTGGEDSRVRRLSPPPGDSASMVSGALAEARGTLVSFIGPGDRLASSAVERLAEAVTAPGVMMAYGDEDRIDRAGRRSDPFFKPDWDPEYFESAFYTGGSAAYRLTLIREVGGLRPEMGAAAEYDLALRVTEGSGQVVHIPRILFHRLRRPARENGGLHAIPEAPQAERALAQRILRTQGAGTVERYGATLHARYPVRGTPRVSVVLPTAGRTVPVRGRPTNLLIHCIASMRARMGWDRVEWIVVHNGDLTPETLAELAAIPCTLIEYAETEVNIARKMNLGARVATGDLLLFLNDDIEAISEGVLAELIQVLQRPGVGAVGAKLYFEDGTIQHGGVVLPGALPYTVYSGARGADPGYFGSLVATRNYLAVTGACLMTTREAFQTVGGFDERLKINYNDIDYCLKLVAKGYRIVFTPHARLFHFESKSRDPKRMYWDEAEYFARKWQRFANRDPYYSRWFAGSGTFTLRA